ncbi:MULTISPECIES: hypothetical protein [unclassified Endozoicomonas]|uniref:hypothetical protein n=1 Tax=unclassified Endozoicomonas TaxID=2644528 RepID=UPI003BB4AB8A
MNCKGPLASAIVDLCNLPPWHNQKRCNFSSTPSEYPFRVPPVLPNAMDNEETILRILQHYHRRPGPERVIQCLGSETFPGVWKPDHNCSHVLRAWWLRRSASGDMTRKVR